MDKALVLTGAKETMQVRRGRRRCPIFDLDDQALQSYDAGTPCATFSCVQCVAAPEDFGYDSDTLEEAAGGESMGGNLFNRALLPTGCATHPVGEATSRGMFTKPFELNSSFRSKILDGTHP